MKKISAALVCFLSLSQFHSGNAAKNFLTKVTVKFECTQKATLVLEDPFSPSLTFIGSNPQSIINNSFAPISLKTKSESISYSLDIGTNYNDGVEMNVLKIDDNKKGNYELKVTVKSCDVGGIDFKIEKLKE
jgi:hypothetical protein